MEVRGGQLERPGGGTAGELRARLVLRVLSGGRELRDDETLPAGPLTVAVALLEPPKAAAAEEEQPSSSPSPPSSPELTATAAVAVAERIEQEKEEEDDEQWRGSLLPRSMRAMAERDVARQETMAPQPPLSASYLAAVPAARRPLYRA
jgi:hypothetical protein